MTSLAKQLQKLAIPGQPSLRQIVSRKRPSLLFDAKEAADIDIETIYALGTNGLEELISIDQSFAGFETNLFEESSKEFERTVQTKEVLEELDRNISVFLRKLSPYFLLKPAQKCMEWLIRTFRINSFNVDAVMECILPYHETKLFARVLQLLPIKNPSSMWHWLRPSQKAASPLSKLTLVQHCISNQPFLVFICEMVPRSVKVHKQMPPSNAPRTVIAFYSSALVSVLEKGTVTEELVSCLLPYIVKGLKSSSSDYKAASYMIVGQLASKVTMEKQLCSSLLEITTKHLGLELLSEGLSCVAILCQTQEPSALSRKTLKYLQRAPSLIPTLSKLCHTHSITPFLQLFLSSLLEDHFAHLHGNSNHNDASLDTIMGLLDEIHLEEETMVAFLSQLLECYVSLCEQLSAGEEEHSNLSPSIAPLAQSLDSKYPKLMDKALQVAVVSMANRQCGSDSKMEEERGEEQEEEEEGEEREEEEGRKEGDSHMRWLHEFVTLALPGSRHQVLPGSGGTLVLGVHHPEPTVRSLVVRQLGQSLRHKRQQSSPVPDAEFISSTLLGRLSDDEPSVVKAALDLGAKLLFKHLPTDDLVSALIQLLGERRQLLKSSSEWQTCAVQALEILTSPVFLEKASHRADDVIVATLPLLFVGRHGNQFSGQLANVLAASALSRDHPLLGGLQGVVSSQVWQATCGKKSNAQTLSAANEAMFCHLGEQLAQLETGRMEHLLSNILTAPRSSPHNQPPYYALLAVVGVAMATVSTHSPLVLQLALELLAHVQENIDELANTEVEGLDVPPTSLSPVFFSLVQKKYPITPSHSHPLLLLWLLNTISEHLVIPEHLETVMWLQLDYSSGPTEEQLYYRVLLLLFSLLTHLSDLAEGTRVTTAGRHMLQRMIQRHFSGRGSLLRFLAMIWTTPSTGLEPDHHTLSHSHSTGMENEAPPVGITLTIQAHSLHIACAYFKSLDIPALLALIGAACPVIPSLLIPLMNSCKTIRDGALHCLSTLHEAITTKLDSKSPQEAYTLLHLVHSICASKLAILADHTYLQQLFGKLFSLEGGMELQPLTIEQTPRGRGRGRRGRKKVDMTAKGAILEAILDCVLMHIIAMGAPAHVQSMLLTALVNVEHQVKLHGALPLLKQLLDKFSHTSNEAMEVDQSSERFPLSEHEGLVLRRLVEGSYTPGMAPLLQTNTDACQLFIQLLGTSPPSSLTTPPPQELALLQVTPEFFAALPYPNTQQEVLQHLIDLLLESQRSKVVAMVKEIIFKLSLSAELVITELNRHVDQLGGGKVPTTPSRKRARHSKPPPTTPEGSREGLPRPWRRVTTLLELIQNLCHTGTITDPHLLPPHLFNLLSKCLDSEDSLRVTLGYTQQLLLSVLLSICSNLTTQGVENARALLTESQFNMELVVQCVRLSSTPLTHHHALLLLGTAATIFPSRVLHNVMPIFTFMGAQLLRQDDQYTFQIISRTIDTVIPALIKSGSAILSGRTHPSLPRRPGTKATPTTIEGVVTEIVRVFVDAAPHVPEHRRLPLFSHLLTTISPPDYLHVALALLTEKCIIQSAVRDQTPRETLLSASFSVSLAQEFSPDVQLLAQLRLLEYVARLPDEKPESSYKLHKLPPAISSLFNVAAHSGKQLRQFKYSVHTLVVAMLSHRAFITKVSSLDSETAAAVEAIILRLLQRVLSSISSLKKLQSECTENTKLKFLEDLLKKAYDIIDKVVSLLSLGSFVEVMSQLIEGARETGGTGGVGETREDVQRKTLEILNTKLEGTRLHFTEEHEPALLTLVGVVVGVAQGDSAPPINKQAALYSIKLLARRLAAGHTEEFVKVSHTVLALLSSKDLHPHVHASSLLCMAELCSMLGPHMIPFLPSLLPHVLQHVGEMEISHVLLHISATTALSVVIQTLPKFLGSHIDNIVMKVCHPNLVVATSKETVQLIKQATEVREHVSDHVPPRTLLPTLLRCYPEIVHYGKDSVLALLSMLSSSVNVLSKDDVKAHTSLLLELFTAALDYRATQTNESSSAVEEVEECCLQAFTSLVVKLSEASFRPMFLKLFDWATHQGAPKDRLITFYHLANSVAEKLKHLFLLFAGHIVKNAVQLLESNSEEGKGAPFFQDEDSSDASEKACLLLCHLLQCLRKCFLYDKGSFLSRERFETLLKPLVNQISNCLGGVERYTQRVESHLVPCLAQFAVAARKDSLWKPLNYQILLKARHKNSQVRFAVLKVLQELYTRLGEEFMILLPETIPFLAELMEDESTEVEQQAQEVISCIENILGESIQHYF